MSVILKTPSNGSVTLAEQDTASDVVVTVPAVNGSFVTADASGNVGLGVTPSAWTIGAAIQVKSGGFYSGGSETGISQNAYYASGWKYIGTGVATRYETFSGTHVWFTAPSGTAGNAISFTQAMTLGASGNLGIGTTSPDAKLDVAGTGLVGLFGSESANNAYIGFKYNSTILGYVGNGSGVSGGSAATEFSIGSTGARALTFGTNDLERARIDASGNLLVGTTSNGNNVKFVVDGASQAGGEFRRNSTGSLSQILFVNPNGVVGQISTSGSSTSFTTSSDYRLKENVAPMTGALEKVQALNPVTYTWKADGSAGQGFIAHELQEVVPDCVTGEKDAVDSEGKPQYQGVDTSFLVATLVAAIQELNAKVTALEAQLQGAA